MRDIIDVRGASGVAYRFTRFREGNPLSAMGGNFIYARPRRTDEGAAQDGAGREGEGAPEVIYVGEAQNLLTDARRLWDQAVAEHGVTDLYTRLNISERTRQQEQSDILAAARPPMNPEEPSAPGEVSP